MRVQAQAHRVAGSDIVRETGAGLHLATGFQPADKARIPGRRSALDHIGQRPVVVQSAYIAVQSVEVVPSIPEPSGHDGQPGRDGGRADKREEIGGRGERREREDGACRWEEGEADDEAGRTGRRDASGPRPRRVEAVQEGDERRGGQQVREEKQRQHGVALRADGGGRGGDDDGHRARGGRESRIGEVDHARQVDGDDARDGVEERVGAGDDEQDGEDSDRLT